MGYTQAQLSTETNLSIRTIQRVESGQTIPKGYTLDRLTETLEIDKSEFQKAAHNTDLELQEANHKLKLINLSGLCFIGIPFGNIFIPYLIWQKNKKLPFVYTIGKQIINIQIIWTFCTMMLLIISPFFQDFFPTHFTLILWVGLLAIIINFVFVIRIALSMTRQEYTLPFSKLQLI